jgi:hypothetical protein
MSRSRVRQAGCRIRGIGVFINQLSGVRLLCPDRKVVSSVLVVLGPWHSRVRITDPRPAHSGPSELDARDVALGAQVRGLLPWS